MKGWTRLQSWMKWMLQPSEQKYNSQIKRAFKNKDILVRYVKHHKSVCVHLNVLKRAVTREHLLTL